MSKRKTQIDKAIERLEGERAVIDAAIAKLRQQQESLAVRSKPTLLDARLELAKG